MPDLGFWTLAQKDPSYLALVDPDGREITSGELLTAANQLVHGLRELGLQQGDSFATVLPNGAPMIELYLAALQAGWYLVPINHHLVGPEIAYIVDDCGAKALIVDERFAEECTAAVEQLDFPKEARFAVGDIPGFRSSDEVKSKHDLSSLRHMVHAAAPCPVDVKRRMIEWWGPVIDEYYAASEGGGTLVTPEEWMKKPGTVGTPWPISEVVVLDDDGNPVGASDIGTVYMAMQGVEFEYYNDEEKTQKNRAGKYFTVGDIGYLDDDGYLFLCDRKADMIISGGANIYPAEIESVLLTNPKVGDAAVFGIPHDDWGEEVKAVIEPAAGVEPSPVLADEILGWCAGRLAKFKTPMSIDFTAEMPRDPNGKLYKRKLRDPYWEGRERAI